MDDENKGVEAIVPKAPEEQNQEQVVDYKAELEKVTTERDNYKQGMLDAKDILKGKGIVTDPEEIGKLIDEKVNEKISLFTANISKSTVESTLESLAGSEDEKKLIQFHYDNSIVKSGLDPVSVRNDLENAKLLANKKAFFKESSELKIALNNKVGITQLGVGANQESPSVVDTVLSKEQIDYLRKVRGFNDDQIEKFKKNLIKSKER